MKKLLTKIKTWASIAAIVLLVSGLFGGCNYISYSTYKTKYPQTTFWMWLLDSQK